MAASGLLDPPLRVGLLALVLAPGELAAPAIATALGGRIDAAGALLAGTVVASFALSLAFLGPVAPAALESVGSAALAFLVGMTFGAALPRMRDRLWFAIRRLADLALLALVVLAVVGAAGSVDLPAVALASAVLALGVAAAVAVARVAGADARAAAAASGTRDFAVAAGLAATVSPQAAAVPLAYGALLLAAAAVAVVRRREPGRR